MGVALVVTGWKLVKEYSRCDARLFLLCEGPKSLEQSATVNNKVNSVNGFKNQLFSWTYSLPNPMAADSTV